MRGPGTPRQRLQHIIPNRKPPLESIITKVFRTRTAVPGVIDCMTDTPPTLLLCSPTRRRIMTLALAVLLFPIAFTQAPFSSAPFSRARADDAKDPGDVKKGLAIINQAAANTGLMVAGKQYEKIAPEHEKVLDAKQILDANLSVEEKTKVDTTLVKVMAASTTLKGVAAAKDAAKIQTAQAAFATSVQDLMKLFPADMQPPLAKR